MRYDYECKNHGIFDLEQRMADDHLEADCPHCGHPAKRKFTPLRFEFNFWYGYDPGMGEYVDSKKQREEFMRAKGLSKAEI